MLPFWSVVTAPVLMVNCPVVEPAATITLAGPVNADNPVLLSVTTAPADGAAFDSVTVQLLLAFDPRVVGLHCNDDITAGATNDTANDLDVLFAEAVTVAV
jgi:hypothetical protein